MIGLQISVSAFIVCGTLSMIFLILDVSQKETETYATIAGLFILITILSMPAAFLSLIWGW